MNLKDIFSAFSHRHREEDLDKLPVLPESFRTRLLILIRERFSATFNGNFLFDLMEELHGKLTMLIGKGILLKELNPSNNSNDVIGFIMNCEDKHVIDFIEYIFQSKYHSRITNENDNILVEDINRLFLADDLPYHLTNFAFGHSTVARNNQSNIGLVPRTVTIRTTTSYPKVILKENEIIHQAAIKPSLSILEKEDFKFAHQEFLDGLTDYRDGDYGDSLTKCASSFESVMQVVCDKNGWAYKQTDTASTLLEIIFNNSNLPNYYRTTFIITATIRNKISKSHGAGTKPKNPSKNEAEYSINQTASSIIFLARELY